MNFNPSGLDLEIEAAMWRNLVEPETFKFTFVEELNSDFAARISDKDYYEKDKSQ